MLSHQTYFSSLFSYENSHFMAQLHKSVAIYSCYPKIMDALNIKKGKSCTPRSCALKPFNLELRDSA